MKKVHEQSEKFIGDNMKELLLSSFESMFSILLACLEDSDTEEEFKRKCAKTLVAIHLMEFTDVLEMTKLEKDVNAKTTGSFSLLADIMLCVMKNEKIPEEIWKYAYENIFS